MNSVAKVRDAIGGFTTVVAALGGFATAIWGLWCTWVAFFGGTFPIPFIHWTTSGGIVLGLVFLFIVTPILTGLIAQILTWLLGICQAE
jgi:hypothetical protein